MHLRKFKSDKMNELLRTNQNSYGNGIAKPYLPYPSYGQTPGVPNIPYPVGPLNMPMPGMYGNHFWKPPYDVMNIFIELLRKYYLNHNKNSISNNLKIFEKLNM